MTKRYTWEDLIPVDEARTAARHLVETWSTLSTGPSKKLKFGTSEQRLTERLHSALMKLMSAAGLTGKWIHQPQYASFDDTDSDSADSLAEKQPVRIRKDIEYFSNRDKRLNLVFEFKKLTLSSGPSYRGADGMGRFVDGLYATEEAVAVMVGIVCTDGDHSAVVKKLRESFERQKVRDALRMLGAQNGAPIAKPSELLPSAAEFDTIHERPAKMQSPDTMTIAHIFVQCDR